MLNSSFHYRNNSLTCDDVPLSQIAEAAGTPVYVYSAQRIKHNVSRLQAAFSPLGASIHYSMKANANLTLLRLLNEAGLGMDAVSGGEILRAIKVGVDPGQIVFAGVGKTRAEMHDALDTGIGCFNVESLDELALLNTLAAEANQMPTVALRLNPGIVAQTHHHIATGHFEAKFGISPDQIAAILAHREDYPHVRISGIHVHIGSQLSSVRETVEAVRLAIDLATPYTDVRMLNIGGGFPVCYTETDEYPEPAVFAEALAALVQGWHVLIEPGRSIVADAGLLLISVLYIKDQGNQRFVISDGSMTDLLRPALYEAVHPIVPVHQRAGESRTANVVGPVCESTDILGREIPLTELAAGDLLAVLVTGAYGMVMASNYNQRPRPPEVLVEGDRWRVIRRRENQDDLLRLEENDDPSHASC